MQLSEDQLLTQNNGCLFRLAGGTEAKLHTKVATQTKTIAISHKIWCDICSTASNGWVVNL